MTVDRVSGPASLVLTAAVARRYFIDGKSRIEIADEFGMSRFKVARLLTLARSTGLVRIEISYPGVVDVDLSARLQGVYGLHRAIVVETPDDDAVLLREHLGRAAAQLLEEIVTKDDVLGLAWARSVSAMTAQLGKLPAVPVVQLTGALSRNDGGDDSSIDLVREVARRSGGSAYFFFAPFVVADASTARALRQHPDTARAFAMAGSVTKAVVGIGTWAPGQSTLYDAANENVRRSLAQQGVCAEVSGVFLKDDGTPIQTELNDRMIGINAEEMRAINEVIGIPYGIAKAPAVLAALRGGYVTTLVTHTSLAHALLSRD
jgi:DNA-binding transcriptional regulator LsrR (DeoR family)